MKYSSNSSTFGAWTNKFIPSIGGLLIFQILEFFDMFHFLFFNFCIDIQTWMSILIKLILKYWSFVQKNQESAFQWWYLDAMVISFFECRVSNKLMILARHSTSFLLMKTSLSLSIQYFTTWYTSWECFLGSIVSSF